ncbi:STE20-related kinase adapter protein alpha [Papilio machaon]|uniref:STE20-related kinase adapter protein alpha n=1 Tax=Papilio machaon TaxID=76193 RepID=A0A194QMW2_PAPMA|nr:STE20-related kinase adapter protein alpha isoform X1 [Papilio machaon]KPJ06867.1 STE20-related kinase adapter protein alpha [Papilio machaon]
MYIPDINEYQLTSIVAECCGGVAVVYSALYKPNNQHVAIKRYFVDKSKEKANLIQQDILTRKELQHPNILSYLTSFVHGKELYVVSPLMSLGSCRDVLDRYFQEGLPELACAIILRDVLFALQYLHKQLYIHRSVRASHVLLDTNGCVKLSGLRSAASMMVRGRRQRQLHNLPPPDHDNANLMWLSPELLEQNLKGYDERSDIYSLGVLCCELANGAVPFSDVPTTLMFTEKVRGNRPQLLDCSSFPEPLDDGEMKNLIWNEPDGMYNTDSGVGDSADGVCRLRQVYAARKLSEPFHHLSEIALQRDPERRPSATQLLNHQFFKQIRKTDFLPSLIGRVKPIKPDANDMSALLLQEKMSEMDIEKQTEWDF